LYKKYLKDGVVNLKTDSEFMHGYTGLLHGEGHEVLYANHNVYMLTKEVRGSNCFSLRKQYLEVNKAITYIRFKIKSNYFLKFELVAFEC
jgi:tRNA (guanine-N7-)-methyltransferase